ncbi:unnamed protein product [Anisakis simplex]|uniref:YTH domain-containing protein n=1 Tax=Anisakis simplex TaxID=6269 RepID=A0A0M3KF98_ANISI|nr:unnamed protein product [Anisakis simplex]
MQPSYRGVSPKTIPVISSTSKTLPSLSSNVLAPPQFPLMDPSVPPPSIGSSLSMNIVNPAATTGGGHLSISGQTNPQSIAGMSYNIRANLADEIRTREPPEEDSGCHRSWNETASSSWSLGKSSSTEMGGRDSAVIDVNQPSTSSKYHPQDSRSASMAAVGVPPDQSQSSPAQCRSRPAFNVEQYFDEADECLGSSAPNYSPHKEKSSLLPTPRQQQQQSQQSHSSSTPLSLYQTPVRDRDDRSSTFSHFQLSAERTCGYSGSQHSPINQQQQQQQRSMQQQPQHQSLASATPTAAIRTPLLSSHQYEPAAVDVNRVLYGNEDVRSLPKWSDEANMSNANQARHTGSSTFMSQTLADNNDRFYQQATAMTTNRPPSYSSLEQTIYSEPPPLAAHLSSRHGQASSAAGYACSSSMMSSPPPAIRLSNAPSFKQNIMGLSHSAPKSHRPLSPLTASAHQLSGGNVTPLGNRGRPNNGRGGGAAAGGNSAFSQQHRAPPQSSSRGGRGSGSGRGSIFEQSRKFFW